MNYFTFLILSLWNPGCMLHLKRGAILMSRSSRAIGGWLLLCRTVQHERVREKFSEVGGNLRGISGHLWGQPGGSLNWSVPSHPQLHRSILSTLLWSFASPSLCPSSQVPGSPSLLPFPHSWSPYEWSLLGKTKERCLLLLFSSY